MQLSNSRISHFFINKIQIQFNLMHISDLIIISIINMEQHLICEICNLRYNLSTREPLLVSCCDETLCRACWRKAFD